MKSLFLLWLQQRATATESAVSYVNSNVIDSATPYINANAGKIADATTPYINANVPHSAKASPTPYINMNANKVIDCINHSHFTLFFIRKTKFSSEAGWS